MTVRPRYGRCPYPGCTAALGMGVYLTRHVEAVHCRCACGWIGVRANHGRHVGQVVRRWGDPEHLHLVAAVLDLPDGP